MPEVQNTLTKYTNKQSCSNPNAIIYSGQGAMEIHVSCACMFEGNVMPWVQTGLFSPQGKYTRKYWCYHIIYRAAVAKEINCILHWALPVCTGTHLRTSPLPERWVLTCTPLSVTMLNAAPYARRLLAGTWGNFGTEPPFPWEAFQPTQEFTVMQCISAAAMCRHHPTSPQWHF